MFGLFFVQRILLKVKKYLSIIRSLILPTKNYYKKNIIISTEKLYIEQTHIKQLEITEFHINDLVKNKIFIDEDTTNKYYKYHNCSHDILIYKFFHIDQYSFCYSCIYNNIMLSFFKERIFILRCMGLDFDCICNIIIITKLLCFDPSILNSYHVKSYYSQEKEIILDKIQYNKNLIC